MVVADRVDAGRKLATKLFAEPGTVQAAAAAPLDWFTRHLAPVPYQAG